jgi:hypothetical protein
MATVGNLFVNVGASTRGLEQGLKKGQDAVKKFSADTQTALGDIAGMIPGVGQMFARLEGFGRLGKSVGSVWDAFNGGAREAAERTKAIAKAQQDLASQKGTRKNIGMARSMLAKEGFDPNKAASQLKIADTSGARAKVTAAINEQRLAVQRLAGAEAFRAKLAKGRDPFTGQFLSAANKAKMLETATSDIAKAQQKLTAATTSTTAAQKALGAVMDSNRKKEALRGKLKGMGIDLGKGQSALRLPSLAAAQERLAALRKEAADAASGFKVFGLSIGKALGPIGLIAAASVAATAGLLALTRSMAGAMARLKDAATAAGIGVEAFQDMENTFHELGVASGTAESASQKLGIKLLEAVQGSDDARKSFAALGLAYSDLGNMSPDAALAATLGKIRELGTHRERIAALRDIFSNSGMGLAAAVNATNEEFKTAQERAAKIRIPAAMVSQLADVNTKVEAAGKAFDKLKTMLASTFAPVLADLADTLFEMFTADTDALMGAFQSIAVTCAVVYDVVALIVNVFKALHNIVMGVGGAVAAFITGGLYVGVEAVNLLVKGFEILTGQVGQWSSGLSDGAEVLKAATKELAAGARGDFGDIGTNLYDAITPGATMGVIDGIANGMQQAQSTVEGEPVLLKAELSKSSLKEVEDGLQKLRDKVQEMTIGGEAVDLQKFKSLGASDAQMAEYEALQKQLVALEQSQAAHETIADLQDQITKATMTAAEFAEYEAVTKKGLSVADAAQVRALTEQLDLLEQQQKAREDIAAAVTDLQTQVDQLGMSEADILAQKLQQLGATDQQIQQAQQLQAILDAAKVDDALKSHFDALNTRLLEAQGQQEELLRKQLEGMGLTGQALEDALQRTLDIEAQITEAERLKANQDKVAGTLEDLMDQLDRLKLGEAGYLEKQLADAGATQAEIAQALAMQAEIAALQDTGKATSAAANKADETQAVTESIDTAFGSMKLAGVVSAGERMQRDLLSETEMQTGLLQNISTAMTAMVGTGQTAGSGILFAEDQPQAIASTVPVGLSRQEADMASLMKQGNEYLKQIVGNTAAFAGVLT